MRHCFIDAMEHRPASIRSQRMVAGGQRPDMLTPFTVSRKTQNDLQVLGSSQFRTAKVAATFAGNVLGFARWRN
jgi:hypothetical protein